MENVVCKMPATSGAIWLYYGNTEGPLGTYKKQKKKTKKTYILLSRTYVRIYVFTNSDLLII